MKHHVHDDWIQMLYIVYHKFLWRRNSEGTCTISHYVKLFLTLTVLVIVKREMSCDSGVT